MLKRIITSSWEWLDDRTGISEMIEPPLKHLVPGDAKWWYVFGGATLLAFMLQVVTGVALAFTYIASSGQAYDTLKFISTTAPFGHFLRGLHYYGASAMVLMVGIHMAQVFLFGSYKYPREMNWVSGVMLLGLTIAMGFTGQLLRWDQTAVWSVVIAAEQAGRVPFIGKWLAHFVMAGDTVGGQTLGRFFAIHVFLLPGLIFAGIGLHLQLILRHGISEPPVPGQMVDPKTYKKEYHAYLDKKGVAYWPWGAWREIVFGTGMLIVIAWMAWYWGAPELVGPPDPSIIAASPLPDWYLLWYFAVLALIPPATENYVMIYAPLLIGLLFIIVPFLNNRGERAPSRRPWAIGAVMLAVLMIGSLWIEGATHPWSPNFNPDPIPDNVIGMQYVKNKTGKVYLGSQVFQKRGCINCHMIAGNGGTRGPNLTNIGNTLTKNDMIIRITHGGTNMPAFGRILKPKEMEEVVAFLQTRTKQVVESEHESVEQ